MTINEQIKILDNKIRSNQAQYDLDRQNAKISALSSDEVDKYEYLTGVDLGYIPDVAQKAKFEYSPLGQVFNKALDAGGKQEGLLKRLKNIEGKNKQQLDLIRDQGDRQLDLIGGINTEKIKPIGFFDKENKELCNNCVMYGADIYAGGDNANNRETTFQIASTKLCVPIVTLSTKDNVNLTKQLNEGFKRTVYWNECKSKTETRAADNNNVARFPFSRCKQTFCSCF